jgi:hypothetical protein
VLAPLGLPDRRGGGVAGTAPDGPPRDEGRTPVADDARELRRERYELKRKLGRIFIRTAVRRVIMLPIFRRPGDPATAHPRGTTESLPPHPPMTGDGRRRTGRACYPAPASSVRGRGWGRVRRASPGRRRRCGWRCWAACAPASGGNPSPASARARPRRCSSSWRSPDGRSRGRRGPLSAAVSRSALLPGDRRASGSVSRPENLPSRRRAAGACFGAVLPLRPAAARSASPPAATAGPGHRRRPRPPPPARRAPSRGRCP